MELDISSIISPALPFLIGLVITTVKPFLESEQNIKKRVEQKRTLLVEKHAIKLCAIFNRQKSILDTHDPLRGDGRNEPDLLQEYSEETFRYFTLIRKLEAIHSFVHGCYTAIFICALMGLIGIVLALVFSSNTLLIAIVNFAGIGLSLAILYMAFLIFRETRNINEYEQTT